MAEKDMTEKHLEEWNDVFADIMNVLLSLDIDPNDLQDTAARTMYKADGGIHEQERDIAKLWKKHSVVLCLMGLENQTEMDPYMTLRVFGYEGADYRGQLAALDKAARQGKPGEPLYPVVTVVLYFGTERRWTGPKTLFEAVNVPPELRPYVNDCRINVFEVAWLPDEQIAKFTSDFRIVADYFRQVRENKDYVPTEWEIQHVDAVLKIMKALTGNHDFEDVQNRLKPDKGRKITMVDVLGKVKEQGMAQGITKVAERLLTMSSMTVEQIAQVTTLPLEEVKALRDKG